MKVAPCALRAALASAIAVSASPHAAAQSHVGNSPFSPPPASDITFVVDQAPGLDTGCTFRSGGPLTFTIKTTRFVGDVNPDGTLVNAAGLVSNGIVSATARLDMPGFDVDYDAVVPPYNPERDQVLFNGQPVDYLRGVNNAWVLNSFEIPIARVKFPARGSNGSAPTPAENTVTINIDTANSDEVWCTAVDWASLAIKALSPVILVHGNNSDGGFFDRQGFTTTLKSKLVPYDNSISMPTETIAAHGARLDALLPAIVKSFGSDSAHLVVHSKGGLDSRDYLATYQPAHDADFKILSYTSLSTPQNGSVLADLKVAYETAAAASSFVSFSGFPGVTAALARLTSLDAGTTNLTTGFVAGFNVGNLGRLPATTVFNTVAADADTNGNARIDSTPDEYAALRAESASLANVYAVSKSAATGIVDAMYQILRSASGVTITYTRRTVPIIGTVITTATVTSVPAAMPLGNDTLVTIPSGLGSGSLAPRVTNAATLSGAGGRNHSNVADGGVASTVLPWIFSVEHSNGDLR